MSGPTTTCTNKKQIEKAERLVKVKQGYFLEETIQLMLLIRFSVGYSNISKKFGNKLINSLNDCLCIIHCTFRVEENKTYFSFLGLLRLEIFFFKK